MSYCQLIEFRDGKPEIFHEFRNAHLGAALIWTCLYDRYLKSRPFDSWLMDSDKLWKLPKDRRLSQYERAVLAQTFDRALVGKDNFDQHAKNLRMFAGMYPDASCGHLVPWAAVFKESGADYIGGYQTSVSEDPWSEWNEEAGESRPYDLNERSDHFDVYEWLEELQA